MMSRIALTNLTQAPEENWSVFADVDRLAAEKKKRRMEVRITRTRCMLGTELTLRPLILYMQKYGD